MLAKALLGAALLANVCRTCQISSDKSSAFTSSDVTCHTLLNTDVTVMVEQVLWNTQTLGQRVHSAGLWPSESVLRRQLSAPRV